MQFKCWTTDTVLKSKIFNSTVGLFSKILFEAICAIQLFSFLDVKNRVSRTRLTGNPPRNWKRPGQSVSLVYMQTVAVLNSCFLWFIFTGCCLHKRNFSNIISFINAYIVALNYMEKKACRLCTFRWLSSLPSDCRTQLFEWLFIFVHKAQLYKINTTYICLPT